MDKKFLVLAIVLAVAFFVIGGALGIIYQTAKDTPLAMKADTVRKLSSNLVVSMVVYGEVKKIEGKSITLASNTQQMTLSVPDSAKIYSLSPNPTAGAAGQRTVAFSEIKNGDKLNMAVSLNSDGKINVQSVIILP